MFFNNLGEYQTILSHCSTCKTNVAVTSQGKYCVRFGSNIKQFCSNGCLETHKKGLKVCCYCQKDISGKTKILLNQYQIATWLISPGPNADSFLAPIGDKGQFKDFCAQKCLKKYEVLHGKEPEKETDECCECKESKVIEVELVKPEEDVAKFCSRTCLSTYKFANKVDTLECSQCKRDFDLKCKKLNIYHDGKSARFCSVACQNVYVMQNRKIVPCAWCKVKN